MTGCHLPDHKPGGPGWLCCLVIPQPRLPMKLPRLLPPLFLLGAANIQAATPESGTPASLREAIIDLGNTFGDGYPGGDGFLKRLDALGPKPAATALAELRCEALLANPLLDIDRLLCVRRNAGSAKLGMPQNWQGNCSLPRRGYQDSIAVLASPRAGGTPAVLYQPEQPLMIGDLDLHFDGSRMVFSMIGSNNCWQIWEVGSDGSGLRQVTPGTAKDEDNYDPCYLPNGKLIFASTRVFQGVPCVGGGSNVANLFTMNPDGAGIRQLCFDQDHDWCPTVLNNGRVLYTRWEYSDIPPLFQPDPDAHESGRHRADRVLWFQLVLAELVVLRPPAAGLAEQGGRHRFRAPRDRPDG